MISDKVKLALINPDYSVLLYIVLFFTAEIIMLFEFPYAFWWIPVISVVLRIAFLHNIPSNILKPSKYIQFVIISLISYIGYAILVYLVPSMLTLSIVILAVMCVILIFQTSEVQNNAYCDLLKIVEDSDDLWIACRLVEEDEENKRNR